MYFTLNRNWCYWMMVANLRSKCQNVILLMQRTNPKSKLMLLNDGGKFKVQMLECSFMISSLTLEIAKWTRFLQMALVVFWELEYFFMLSFRQYLSFHVTNIFLKTEKAKLTKYQVLVLKNRLPNKIVNKEMISNFNESPMHSTMGKNSFFKVCPRQGSFLLSRSF